MIHCDAVGIGSTVVVKAELNAIFDADLSKLANFVALAVNIAVAPVKCNWNAAT